MRNLCIDIGNTRTKFAVFDNAKVVDNWTLPNDREFIIDDRYGKIDGAMMCSTIDVKENMMEAFLQLPCPIHEVLNWQTPLPVEHLSSPLQTLGMDRLAAVVGAHAH